jgi:hypothetical protein
MSVRLAVFGSLVGLLLGACGSDSDVGSTSANERDGAPGDAAADHSMGMSSGDASREAATEDRASMGQPDAVEMDRADAVGVGDAMDSALPTDSAKVSDAASTTDAASPTDSANVADAKDAAVDAGPSCASGPFVTNTVTVRDVSTGLPLPGATVKASICGTSQSTDAGGVALLMLPAGLESWIRLEAPGEIPTIYPARTLASNQAENHVILNDQYRQGYFPDYDANNAEILVNVAAYGGATTPCNTYDGVTISVVGHPEAVVTYWMGGFPNMKAVGATATTATGTATITGIASGVQVFLDVKKTGCTIAFDYPNSLANPKIPLETGAVTFVVPGVKN